MVLRVPSSSTSTSACIFCQIARSSTSTTLLHSDEKVVAFQDINPSAFRHYLVIPVEHIPTVNELQQRAEDFALVSHMLDVGQTLLHKDAPNSKQYRTNSLTKKKKKKKVEANKNEEYLFCRGTTCS